MVSINFVSIHLENLKKPIINLKQVLFSYIVVVFLAMFVVNGIRIGLAVQVKANYQLRSCVKFA